MNLHQLNVFRAIVETGSFSKAASHLHIAQSAVSYHIKALEQEIGKPLFLRYKTQVLLTEKGRRLNEHVDKIFEAVDGARLDLCGDTSDDVRELHLGLGVSSLTDRLPFFAEQLRAACPKICFNVAIGSTPQIINLLRTKALDLGVVSLPVVESEVETIPLFYEEEEMVVVISKSHKLAGRDELTPDELDGLPLILYDKSTSTRGSLDKFFQDADIVPTIFMEVNREDTILELVRGSLGAAILPRCVLGPRFQDEKLSFLRLAGAYLRREVGIALTRSAHRLRIVDTAVALCKRHFSSGDQGAIPGQALVIPAAPSAGSMADLDGRG
jgi:LysR family hydrogen peroxide-inducible transcriptional activator